MNNLSSSIHYLLVATLSVLGVHINGYTREDEGMCSFKKQSRLPVVILLVLEVQ